MVIVCPECKTKFRVDPERIPETGTKVRCARCKHVFKATKPAEKPVFAAAVIETPPPEAVEPQEQAAEETEEESFSFEEPTGSLTAEPVEEEFSYDQFRATEEEEQAAEETFTFSGDGAATAEDQFTLAAPDKPETLVSEGAAAAEQIPADVAPASDTEMADPFTPVEETPAAPAKEKSGAMASAMRIILLLVLGILILGGVLVYMDGPEQVQQTIQQLLGQQADRPVQTGQISLDKLQGSFIENQETGELFVIRGEATNKFSEPRASIQLKGVIFDANGKPLLQKTIFAGNPITDQDLRSLPFGKIEELMGNQFGQSLSNMNVNTDQAIPFAIVFRDLPKSLSEFSVNVTSSQPAAR